LTGAAISSATYTAPIVLRSDYSSVQNFLDSFNQQFSSTGLAAAATVGAVNGMFATSMFSWAGVPNSIKNVTTVPGFVLQANKFLLGQAAGKAAQAAVHSSQE
jgi:filamentous hemagglutinin